MSDGWATYRPEYRPHVPPLKQNRTCACGIRDEHGRYPIGWCGPACEGRPLRGRHRRRA